MELDRIFLLCVKFEDTFRFISLVSDFAVRSVVAEKDVILFCEGKGLFIEGIIGHSARRIIGVVEKEKLCLFADLFRYLFQFREKSVFFLEVHHVGRTARKDSGNFVDGIAR